MNQPISMELIKALRDKTGVGIGKCKEALEKCAGNLEEAVDYLRKTGMAQAVKKEGRATNEGMIGVADGDDALALVEINAETDFVVKNDAFQDFVKTIAKEVVTTKPTSLESFLAQPFSGNSTLSIDEYRATIVQMIGENIQIRRLYVLPKQAGHSYGVYTHLGGKVVTVTELEGSGENAHLAREIAMHIAASSPEYIAPEHIPPSVLESEQEVIKSQMAGQIEGKPEFVVQKILDGKLNAYYTSVCLSHQPFIKDESVTIRTLLDQKGKDLAVTAFTRWNVGQEL